MDGTVVRFTFVILWLAEFTCSIFSTFYAHAKHIGPTKQCYTDTLSPLASLGYVAFALYDTLVFFVISIKILSYDPSLGWRRQLRLFFDSRKLTHLYRTVLETGQHYYL